MSRRLNRDPLPLHKTEACSTILQLPDLARGSGFHSSGFVGFVDGLAIGM